MKSFRGASGHFRTPLHFRWRCKVIEPLGVSQKIRTRATLFYPTTSHLGIHPEKHIEIFAPMPTAAVFTTEKE